jgi:hypothetical protein
MQISHRAVSELKFATECLVRTRMIYVHIDDLRMLYRVWIN